MNIIQKFEVVSSVRSVSKPSFLDADKSYPIIRAMKRSHLSHEVVIFAIRVNEVGSLGFFVLSPSYSAVVNEDDLAIINNESEKFKIIYRKRENNCCENCYFLGIEY
jgi:predicted peptidase